MTTREIESHALTWRRRWWTRELMFALGAALVVGALTIVFAPGINRNLLTVLSALIAFAGTLWVRLLRVSPWKIDAAKLARHLDRQHPELEESSALWLRDPEGLSLVEKLQLMRLDRAFAKLPQPTQSPAAPPTGALRAASTWLAGGAMLAILAGLWAYSHPDAAMDGKNSPTPTADVKTTGTPPPKPAAPPQIERADLLIVPPAYTGRAPRTLDGLNAEVEEGSVVRWRVTVSGDLRELSLRFGDNGRKSLPMLALGDGRFEASRVVADSSLYALSASLTDGGNWNPSDIYFLKILMDRPPTVRFLEPSVSRTEVRPSAANSDPARVAVRVAGTDDYGLVEAHLVATVAKGTGEAVKFREQVIEFDPPADSAGPPTTREFTKTLDLAALGLEPGDELYFHVAARDNREPNANHARSETRFVLLKGPDDKTASPGLGVSGVNLVPPYFRSQRQLIIDTEKLVADRSTLSEAEFRRRSNELGIDQQLLRLRYGQFLGEELEEGAGAHAETGEAGAAPADASGIPLDMMHQHDRGPEGSDAMASREAVDPAKPSTGLPPTPAEIIEPYVDQHDSQDQATFHDRPTKDSLRTALGAMWESEGFLRTTRPAEALPAENRALEILKALQQSARAYVQRVGFEPAPLKIKERRLQGDVTNVERLARDDASPAHPDDQDQTVRDALRAVWWQRRSGNLAAAEIEVLQRAEPRLVDAATRDPDAALAGLQALRRLTSGSADVTAELPTLERALWKLLPAAQPLPHRANESSPELSRAYFRALQTTEAKP
jgi:hypothetical protein